MGHLKEQGVDNFVFTGNSAVQAALHGDKDKALELLLEAAQGGWAARGNVVEVVPQFEVLVGDPRLDKIQAVMLATINRDRDVVGLPPLTEDYEVVTP